MLELTGKLSGRMIFAAVVGGVPGVLALAHWDAKEASKRMQSSAGAPRPFDEKSQFLLMLASVLFRIDGTISSEEQEYLDANLKRAPEGVQQRIASILTGKDIFVEIRNWYRALSDASKKDVAAEAQRLVSIDTKRAEEEEAFLIQLAQIVEGHDQVNLLVSSNQDTTKGLLIDHGLFRYVSRQDFEQFYSQSTCAFRAGAIYTPHPYLAGSLITFAIEEFENAQEHLFNGIIELLKELNAKSVIISECTEEKQTNSLAASGSVDGSTPLTRIKIDAGGTSSHDQLLRSSQDAKVEFDGSKRAIGGIFRTADLQQELLRKYRNNHQCQTIIKTRFGDNKASSFEYKFKSTEARNIAKGMNAAAKFDQRLVGVGAAAKADTNGSYTRTIEKNLLVQFH